MERLNGAVMNVHSTWLASSISCCFPRLRDQPVEGTSKEHDEDLMTESATSSRRQSPIPVSSTMYRHA